MSYITKQILTTSLNIKPNEIHKDIDTLIQRKLIGNVEGLCYEDGYIINGSVRILKRNMGKNCSICVLDKAHRFTYMN